MGRDEEVDRRQGHRRSNPAMGERPSDRARDIRIRDELAEAQLRHGAPNGNLKRCAR
jgi:hypothetical protein